MGRKTTESDNLDSINRRISKVIGNTTTTYTYTGWQVAEENETLTKPKKTKVTTRSYSYGPYIDEPIMMQITQPNGNKRSFWYLYNQQYSVYALLNDNGKVVETYRYSAYGKPSIKNAVGAPLAVSAHDNTYMYTGRNQDSETGLQYFRNRYYSDSNGGFISRDPIGYKDGMSLYRGYFNVNKVDPSGLSECIVEGEGKTDDDDIINKNIEEDWGLDNTLNLWTQYHVSLIGNTVYSYAWAYAKLIDYGVFSDSEAKKDYYGLGKGVESTSVCAKDGNKCKWQGGSSPQKGPGSDSTANGKYTVYAAANIGTSGLDTDTLTITVAAAASYKSNITVTSNASISGTITRGQDDNNNASLSGSFGVSYTITPGGSSVSVSNTFVFKCKCVE